MRKALVPMIASLALCGAATGALICTNASAASTPKKPVVLAMMTTPGNAGMTAAPGPDGPPPGAMLDAPGDMGGPMTGPADGKMGERFRAHMTQMCKDIYAHKVGELAFLEAKLSLTSAQTGAFAHWKQVSLDIAQHHSSECSARTAKFGEKMAARKAGERPSVIDRLAREEDRLKGELADIQAERPALAALYNSLTPDQRNELGHGGGMGRPGGGRMMMGMMGHRGPMGPGMGGPMGGPMGPMHGPADAPPPPPAQ